MRSPILCGVERTDCPFLSASNEQKGERRKKVAQESPDFSLREIGRTEKICLFALRSRPPQATKRPWETELTRPPACLTTDDHSSTLSSSVCSQAFSQLSSAHTLSARTKRQQQSSARKGKRSQVKPGPPDQPPTSLCAGPPAFSGCFRLKTLTVRAIYKSRERHAPSNKQQQDQPSIPHFITTRSPRTELSAHRFATPYQLLLHTFSYYLLPEHTHTHYFPPSLPNCPELACLSALVPGQVYPAQAEPGDHSVQRLRRIGLLLFRRHHHHYFDCHIVARLVIIIFLFWCLGPLPADCRSPCASTIHYQILLYPSQ